MMIDIDGLECISAFDLAAGHANISVRDETACPSPCDIRLTELQDVLYLPSVLERGQSVCIVNQRAIPKESILRCRSVDFLKNARRNHPVFQNRYADDFDVEYSCRKVCILGNIFSRNFGHWTEELLKVAILESSEAECSYVISDLPPFARDFLVFLGIPADRILSTDRPTVFARAVFTTAIDHENVSRYSPVLFRLRDMVGRRLEGPSRYGPRLWLERNAMVHNTGSTRNREEAYSCIGKYDFEIVDMAILPVADQLRAMRDAKIISGPHGAQFVHAQFMPMGSTVVECFSPMHVNPSILQICRALKHSYHQVVSRSHQIDPYAYGRDCQVDCEHLELVLDACCV